MKNKKTLSILLALLALPLYAASSLAQQSNQSVNGLNVQKVRPSARKVSAMPIAHIEKRGHLTYAVGSVVINAPREKVWDILVDYDKSPEIFANLSLCKVVGKEGEVKLVRQVVKPGGPIKFDYIVNLTETRPSLIKWNRRSGSLKEVMGTWELEAPAHTSDIAAVNSTPCTTVTYSIHLDGGFALPPWLLASQVKGYLPTVLSALKTRVETKPGTSS
ncbi:MAG: SRPBCC family protein [Candidatus Obscuribacter sp.]|nr:SRPBCC family protein [Candidatus Obscuribacter sp.]MBK9204488.1 SRPBCC family protein [Candidatus Obscuribacter sp.]MBK9773187.1 SRPBCC family protein [Candidatus Obscuribacter sp.]